jgi:hypothetical protein
MVDTPPDSLDPAHRVSDEAERARALTAVLRDQAVRAEAARETAARRHRRGRLRRGALVVAWVAMAYVWLASPSWTRIKAPPEQSVASESRSLRLNVFLQSQAIESYRLTRGKLPDVLQQAGPPFPGMDYRLKDSRSYELQGTSARVRVRYESEQSPLAFVGGAADLLGTGPLTAPQGPGRQP